MTTLIIIERETLRIGSLAGYYDRFFTHLHRTKGNNRQAWERLEAEYFELFKKNRYKSYESFRNGKSLFLKKKIKTTC